MNNQLFNLTLMTKFGLVVKARVLHKFLEVDTRFDIWFKRQLKYGFIEKVDYLMVEQKCSTIKYKNPITKRKDYYLKMDMAKEISMIQHNKKGKQARQYLIEVEKKLIKKTSTKSGIF